MNIVTTCNQCGTEYSQNLEAYSNLIERYSMTDVPKQTILKGLSKAKGWKFRDLGKFSAKRNKTTRGERQYLVKGSFRNLLNIYSTATDEQIV